MGNPYTSQSIASYNTSPPPDDGTQSEANRTKYATVKTKLADPVKTLSEAINTAVSTAFGKIALNSVTSVGGDYTVQATDQGKLIRITGAGTITTPSAATVGAPFMFAVKNEHTAGITIDGNASETVDGAATLTLLSSNTVMLMTDGTNWFSAHTVGVSVADVQNQAYVYAADTGSANVYVADLAVAPTAYAAGQRFAFKAANGNTGASTVDFNSLGAKNIVTPAGSALAGGEIVTDQIVEVMYDGTSMMMTSPVAEQVDVQTYTTDGTWTKPGNAVRVLAQLWGAGGSGANGQNTISAGGGGGGGGYIEVWFNPSDLSATEDVSIGTGGAGSAVNNTDGAAGGNTTFGLSPVRAIAYGGGGGGVTTAGGGGGGGGSLGAGTSVTGDTGGNGGSPHAAAADNDPGFGGGNGTDGNAAGAASNAGHSHSGGGGGGGAGNGGGGNGGDSFNGGGGGGGGDLTSGPGTGGTSSHGGNGGNGNTAGSAASNGTQPGGGGGGSEGGGSGSGGDGQVIITTWISG